jgi:hypothetical protein
MRSTAEVDAEERPMRSTESTAEEGSRRSTAEAAEEASRSTAKEVSRGTAEAPRNGRPMHGSRIQVRRRTNTEGISDNQQVTRNGVKERKKERTG